MPETIIIRLHPEKPCTGEEFTDYLIGLTITAYDLSFDQPEGDQTIGQANYSPEDPEDNQIFQHLSIPPPPSEPGEREDITRDKILYKAVATAIIEVPTDRPEYKTTDLRLKIERDGKTLVYRRIDYNCSVVDIPSPPEDVTSYRIRPPFEEYPPNPPDQDSFDDEEDYQRALLFYEINAAGFYASLEPTSLYIALSSPGRERDPDDAYVEPSEDGTPPKFAEIRDAVEKVLKEDPTVIDDGDLELKLSQLTPTECRHIAHEIAWNRQMDPLPVPLSTLEDMYTGPNEPDSDFEQNRNRFEAELASYYAIHNAEAERLSKFVFSLSAAIFCERESKKAKRVTFRFPVLPEATGSTTKIKEGEVVLTWQTDRPSFLVPADYFYALAAGFTIQVTPQQRYQMACHETEGQILSELSRAIESKVIVETSINRYQAARRLRALAVATGTDSEHEIETDSLRNLIFYWLNYIEDNIVAFWSEAMSHDEYAEAHLDLVLCAVTNNHSPLINEIKDIPVNDIDELVDRTVNDWRDFFHDYQGPMSDLLPPFTAPGTAEERIEAFIRHLQKFFDVTLVPEEPPAPTMDSLPILGRLGSDPISGFILSFGDPLPLGTVWSDWDGTKLTNALKSVFPVDPSSRNWLTARNWLTEILQTINDLYILTTDIAGISPEFRFSLMEALYSRGFTSIQSVRDMHFVDFVEALIGTVAYAHASAIYQSAEGEITGGPEYERRFQPVNPDGSLANCIPPSHLSPLGPVAYLYDMLRTSLDFSTCENPFEDEKTLEDWIFTSQPKDRAGRPFGELHVTRANLETPIPLIDIVNECLEFLASDTHVLRSTIGTVYNTAVEELGGHKLQRERSYAGSEIDQFLHDPVTLFEALPEHSSPSTPVKQALAYSSLRSDFSSPLLPYSQPLDISRSYLTQLGTSRYETMRRFRKDITELVLDPSNEPDDFQRHLWRYPVRIDIAREYLGVTPEEYNLLFIQNILESGSPSPGDLLLRELYGFDQDEDWIEIVTGLDEFLRRTGLSYCEFIELWKSKFVDFGHEGSDGSFPDCEPCCLDEYRISFVDPESPYDALRRLAVFIRLWHKLQKVKGARYTFSQLRDICEVLNLINESGNINPDFIRQLAAFQMLRDDLDLELADQEDIPPEDATGANRTHLLALWIGETASKWSWAVDQLIDQVKYHAQARYKCQRRPPEFLKLLEKNLDPLSCLVGFDPDIQEDTWHYLPTHTLRFAEVLAKIYASDFGVGEILFMFTVKRHLDGDDPFPLQPDNEALDSPLGLPDDERTFPLWKMRRKLLDVDVSPEEAQSWTWLRIEASLRDEFGFIAPISGPNPLLSLGEHFFPTILEASGLSVDIEKRQYRVNLSTTSDLMWNTPPAGPFRYDSGAEQLWIQLPLTDEAVMAKLSRIRPLDQDERIAVRELYFSPRVDLARFAFIFASFAEADERLIQEADEEKRWAYFQQEFARFRARCQIIAEHLASHVNSVTGQDHSEGESLAWRLLKHLFADENMAKTPPNWEDDSGTIPDVTWMPQPIGGAFTALLGLAGTGLLGEFVQEDKDHKLTWEDDKLIWKENEFIWREARGPMDAFGPEENAWNSPIPTILPNMSLELSPDQMRFVGVRNGFAMKNEDGAPLGGTQGFAVRWSGVLLIENEGSYEFRAGAPTPDGEDPDFEKSEHCRWRVKIERGQTSCILLSHQWPDEEAPAACSAPLQLKRGAYHLTVEFVQLHPPLSRSEEISPQSTGFQVKYSGPDSKDQLVAIPLDKLFRDIKDQTLGYEILQFDGVESPACKQFLELQFISTMRDIRRTYQRAFKALLFAHRFALSAKPIADDGQSEIDYMLTHADEFAGRSYYRNSTGFGIHNANFDFNLLPLLDNYKPPSSAHDQHVQPSSKRQQALFDWWERVFDYTIMRREAQTSRESPVWLLFHEAAEKHTDRPAHLLRHMGVDLRHADLVLRYWNQYEGIVFELLSDHLIDDRWAVRAWQVEKWIRDLLYHFAVEDIRYARPELWSVDDPSTVVTVVTRENIIRNIIGNENLTKFFRDGCIENGEPRRYEEIKRLNDSLRERARQALLAFLCGMNRVLLPWGSHAEEPKHLSELLLIDVETGICEKASRIEEAISAIQIFIQRCRLGLEPDYSVSPEFVLLWDHRLATFKVWEACKRREIYKENWIDWDEFQKARRTESYRFLEAELRRATLTIPVPGGLDYWPNQRPPTHPGLTLLQARDPSVMQRLSPPIEGFDLLGTPERHARPSWLAALHEISEQEVLVHYSNMAPPTIVQLETPKMTKTLPFWLESAIRLGIRFVRVAAAGSPPASTTFEPRRPERDTGCCVECDQPQPALVDEYYFWLIDSRYFDQITQNAEWRTGSNGNEFAESDWHNRNELPKLLHWASKPMVHLAWCRLHNGEFQQPRRSDEGVRLQIEDGIQPNLEFLGRSGDSLSFEIGGGKAPDGFPDSPQPGFRYDLATDTAVVLPMIVEPTETNDDAIPEGLAAYPYFAYFAPGAPLVPSSLFSPVLSIAGWLRAHCRFEAALKWYELFFNPLSENCIWWTNCPEDEADLSVLKIKNRSIILHYIETLLQWGDAMMRLNSPEAFQLARLIFDTTENILGDRPHSVSLVDFADEPGKVTYFEPLAPPLNPRLLSLYDLVDDRLALIHACLNARRLRNGLPNKDMPYWGNIPTRQFWQSKAQICHGWQPTAKICHDDDWCCPHSPYRFLFLVQKAQEIANDVRALGAALLGAFEKGDAEYLASLRSTHERQLLNLTLEIRQNQWREADWQVQALRKTKEGAQTRKRYYESLIQRGLNSREQQYENLIGVALGLIEAGIASEAIAQILGFIPDMWFGNAGPFPTSDQQLPLGTKLSQTFSAAARMSNSSAEIASTTASLRLTQAGWDRREEEWRHQVEVLGIEIEQIERQILAAERRRDIALRELNNHQRQMEQAAEVHDFLRDKFTSHELYLWLQKETSAIYYQMYELALLTARQAQRAFNFERGHTAKRFVPSEVWDNLHEGLQAGERLQLSLRQMEKAYLDVNIREYELTKHISLRLNFPVEFLLLKRTGYCEIEIPEWMFDLDYPGQYMRRIKNITLTIPCVVGPYTGVHCRLTLLSSTTRVEPYLRDPPASCCEDGKPLNAYQILPDDPRAVKLYAATEAIATSSGQNDSGMFELNFRDERYLPFEFAGAVCRWRIELPQENNQFDIDTLSDVILHLNYTAREGGEILRQAANEAAQKNLPGAGQRFFDVKHEFPDLWQHFQSKSFDEKKLLELRVDRNMFPYLPGNRGLWINRLEIFFEAPGAEPSSHHIIEFVADQRIRETIEDHCEYEIQNINCIASIKWPGLYHGVLTCQLGSLSKDGYCDLGALRFSHDVGEISRVFLFYSYDVR